MGGISSFRVQTWFTLVVSGFLRRFWPVASIGGNIWITRHADVIDVLTRDEDFTISEINQTRTEHVNGPFVLSMDKSEQHDREKALLNRLVSPDDLDRIRKIVQETALSVVQAARQRGQIDVVEELTHFVPLVLLDRYFGVPGPDQTTMKRWMRALFNDLFLNLNDDPVIRKKSEDAFAGLKPYMEKLIVSRQTDVAQMSPDRLVSSDDDLLTRLLLLQREPEFISWLDNDTIRRNLAGLIIGSVDTVSKATTQGLDELFRRPDALKRAIASAKNNDVEGIRRTLWEALRFYPHNPIVLRHSRVATKVGGRDVPAGKTIFVGILSAMFDSGVFKSPDEFNSERNNTYLHFGYGLHACQGRYINGVVIPELAAALLRLPNLKRVSGSAGQIGFDGPFPESWTLAFDPISQSALTVVTPIIEGKEQDLKCLLKQEGLRIKDTTLLPVKELTTVHFMRWVVIDKTSTSGARLALSTDYDGPLDTHLDELISVLGDGFTKIYELCEGTAQGTLKEYLIKHQINYEAFYIGHRMRTVEQIKNESELRESIQNLIDSERHELVNKSGLEIRKKIQEQVLKQSKFQWVKQAHVPYKPGSLKPLLMKILSVYLVGFVITLILTHSWLWGIVFVLSPIIFLLVLVLLLFATLRIKESGDKPLQETPDPEHIQELRKREDHEVLVQNQLTHIVEVKDGWFRDVLVRFVLRVINLLAAQIYFKGALGGIPSIHFARWVLIDKKTLLFFSNFDGSWENYLGDFIDRAAAGLTGVWSNTVGFPRTLWKLPRRTEPVYFTGGAKNDEAFKNWTRYHQIPTQFWYSAYPRLTVQNVNNNTEIRAGLIDEMTDEEAKTWCQLL